MVYHNAIAASGVRTRQLYDPASPEPYPLSRTKVELLLNCPRCFVLDRKYGVGRPDDMTFALNLAVDVLLKREFDGYRAKGEPHPLMHMYGVEAIPLRHPQLELWRDTPTGIRALHKPTNFEVFGIIDDLWQQEDGSLIVVDYKATSTGGIAHVADIPRLGYERQLELYQWLLRRSGFAVSSTAYLVFANADRDRPSFEKRLDFSLHLVPHIGDDGWVEDALLEAKRCLDQETLPAANAECKWCAYRREANRMEHV